MSNFENKIEAANISILKVFKDRQYTVEYYQREYSWEQMHIVQLVDDLCNAFLDNYENSHGLQDAEDYNGYYLGPLVLSKKLNKYSIIDGQQRLTSLTLFLIYLNHKQKELELSINISEMILDEPFGRKLFNIDVLERKNCLDALFNHGKYTPPKGADKSTVNMVDRYQDISSAFSEKIDAKALPLFLEWLKRKVVLVEIVAHSDKNAYTIFETMNDRGQNITPTEMLKGFLISKYRDDKKRERVNEFWKKAILELKGEDEPFVKAWLRAKYAESIRPREAGALNEDFEKIGTRFHNWVRDNKERIGLVNEAEFDKFINVEFKYYAEAYGRIKIAEKNFTPELDYVHYIRQWGIIDSLRHPLMFAPLKTSDSVDIANKKMNIVAKYIDIFCVRRSINFHTLSSGSIRTAMYNLVKEIRDKDLNDLVGILSGKLDKMDEGEPWDGFDGFYLHGKNKPFVKYLLSRLSGYVDCLAGKDTNFTTYYCPTQGKPFEIEHLWENNSNNHKDEREQPFKESIDFDKCRNSIGALVLLPNGPNQSHGADPYVDKLKHYIKENTLVKSLNESAYIKDPNFQRLISSHGLKFRPHPEMKIADIDLRRGLYRQIAEKIWCLDDLKIEGESS